jgi:DNA-binding beta-propeller fold protein YncE
MIHTVLPTALLACAVLVSPMIAAGAELAVSANDNKVVLVNGQVKTVENPRPDTVSIIDIAATPPRLIAELEAPASVVGPPTSVALAPDGSLALVTAAMKLDPNDRTKTVADSRMTVIDLTTTPPRVIATVETGKSPAGVSINRQGTLALVANRGEGTVGVFTISGKTVTAAGKVPVGDEKSGPSHVAISPDGKLALVTRDGDERISVLSIDGTKVEYTKRDIAAGLRPYGIDIAASGEIAVVANIGRGGGDADTVSLIDLRAKPPRVVDTITVGQTPEGVKIAPDGSLVAVVVMNGSNKPKESPFFNDAGKVVLLRAIGSSLHRVAEAPVGHWSQGAAFSSDGRLLLVGNMVEKDVQVFEVGGASLTDTGTRIRVSGGAAAIRTIEK